MSWSSDQGSLCSCTNTIQSILKNSNFFGGRGCTKVSVFRPTSTPIYPRKMDEIRNSHLAIQTSQNQSPISFQLSMKIITTFCSIWDFRVQMGNGPGVQRSKGNSLGQQHFFKHPLFYFLTIFLTFGLYLNPTSKGWKESISFEKNFIKENFLSISRHFS